MSHTQTKLQISFSELNESQMKFIACCHVFRQKIYVRRKNHSNTSRVFVAINNSTNENPRLVCAEWDQTLARTGVTSLQLTCGTRWEATVVTTCWRAVAAVVVLARTLLGLGPLRRGVRRQAAAQADSEMDEEGNKTSKWKRADWVGAHQLSLTTLHG
jgi:hypothetical protein